MAWLLALHHVPSVVRQNITSPYAHVHLSAEPGTPVECAEEAGMPCASRAAP